MKTFYRPVEVVDPNNEIGLPVSLPTIYRWMWEGRLRYELSISGRRVISREVLLRVREKEVQRRRPINRTNI